MASSSSEYIVIVYSLLNQFKTSLFLERTALDRYLEAGEREKPQSGLKPLDTVVSVLKTGFCLVAQIGAALTTVLPPQPLEGRNYRGASGGLEEDS